MNRPTCFTIHAHTRPRSQDGCGAVVGAVLDCFKVVGYVATPTELSPIQEITIGNSIYDQFFPAVLRGREHMRSSVFPLLQRLNNRVLLPSLVIPVHVFIRRLASTPPHPHNPNPRRLRLRLQQPNKRDNKRRRNLRKKLARARTVCPLFDTQRWVRDAEDVLRWAWERHEAGLPPAHYIHT